VQRVFKLPPIDRAVNPSCDRESRMQRQATHPTQLTRTEKQTSECALTHALLAGFVGRFARAGDTRVKALVWLEESEAADAWANAEANRPLVAFEA
jgi:hypothetical protein